MCRKILMQTGYRVGWYVFVTFDRDYCDLLGEQEQRQTIANRTCRRPTPIPRNRYGLIFERSCRIGNDQRGFSGTDFGESPQL